MLAPCSVALCHFIPPFKITQATVAPRVTQRMVRKANQEAEFAQKLEERETAKEKRKARWTKPKYDYTNPPMGGGKTIRKVHYQKPFPRADVEDICDDDSTNVSEGAAKNRKSTTNRRVANIKDHIYYNLYPWTTVTELAEHLVQTKIYEDKHYLVLNKPVGVLQDRPLKTSGARCYGRPPLLTYSLTDAIPIMKQITGALNLRLCYGPEKWNSGVTVLAKHNTAHHIACYECRSRANERGLSNRQFWALTRYVPQPAVQARKKVGCLLEPFDDYFVPVFVNKASNTSNKRNIVSAFYVDHTTLATSLDTGAALVQTGMSSTKRYALRVWLSRCLAPVFGDHLLGGRVGELMGCPVPVPYSRASSKQVLRQDLLQKLDLNPSNQELLPLFIHLRTVKLPNYHAVVEKHIKLRREKYPEGDPLYGEEPELEQQKQAVDVHNEEDLLASGKGGSLRNNEGKENDCSKDDVIKQISREPNNDDVEFTAPLPDHFQWTMDRLGIRLDADDTFGY